MKIEYIKVFEKEISSYKSSWCSRDSLNWCIGHLPCHYGILWWLFSGPSSVVLNILCTPFNHRLNHNRFFSAAEVCLWQQLEIDDGQIGRGDKTSKWVHSNLVWLAIKDDEYEIHPLETQGVGAVHVLQQRDLWLGISHAVSCVSYV